MKYKIETIGEEMHKWASDLFPIPRSLTGNGVRETLSYLSKLLPDLKIHSIPSGKDVYDWKVPDEWLIRDAYICDESGKKIIDFKSNNLHLVGYSIAVDQWFTKGELLNHIYTNPDLPDAIPYITSYYSKHWGFCMSENQCNQIKEGLYRVVIDCDFINGVMNYGELIIPGKLKEEILLSTYICHPSMANNELSGPVVATALSRWILEKNDRKYTYRIIFIPETIGAITYIFLNSEHLKKYTVAGYQLTCIGDERCYSFLPSRYGNSLSDKAALHVLKYLAPNFKEYTFLSRGSDERQFCSPGIDLPIASIMRSKYGEYPEYHTSFDDLKLVTAKGLEGGFNAVKKAIEAIEINCIPIVTVLCEPQMGKRGLYPTLSTSNSKGGHVKTMMNLIAYSDGTNTLLEIAEIIGVPIWEIEPIFNQLILNGVIKN
jgi:aminopeptidase-like protein